MDVRLENDISGWMRRFEIREGRINSRHKIRKLMVVLYKSPCKTTTQPSGHHVGCTAWGAATSVRPGGRPLRYTFGCGAAIG